MEIHDVSKMQKIFFRKTFKTIGKITKIVGKRVGIHDLQGAPSKKSLFESAYFHSFTFPEFLTSSL